MFRSTRKGPSKFFLRADEALEVLVAGSFNQWKPAPMFRQADGSFLAFIPLPKGAHEYKFIVDGSWRLDPDNHLAIPNAFGSENSLALVV